MESKDREKRNWMMKRRCEKITKVKRLTWQHKFKYSKTKSFKHGGCNLHIQDKFTKISVKPQDAVSITEYNLFLIILV